MIAALLAALAALIISLVAFPLGGGSSAVEHESYKFAVAGSIPACPTTDAFGLAVCEISIVFGEHTGAAYRVALCESRMQADAIGAAGEVGLLQLHPVHRPLVESLGYSWDDMFNPAVNAQVAYVISAGGTDWSAWSCSSEVRY